MQREDTLGSLSDEEIARHMQSIRRLLGRMLRPQEIDDAAQTVLQRVLETRGSYRSESTPKSWILGVTRLVGLELARERERQPRLAEDPNHGNSTGDIVLEWQEPTQEEELERKQQQALTRAALDGLRAEDRRALLVTYGEERPGAEAAEILGLSFPAFRQRLSRARLLLARRLKRPLRVRGPGAPPSTFSPPKPEPRPGA